jgi:hypothetical protein
MLAAMKIGSPMSHSGDNSRCVTQLTDRLHTIQRPTSHNANPALTAADDEHLRELEGPSRELQMNNEIGCNASAIPVSPIALAERNCGSTRSESSVHRLMASRLMPHATRPRVACSMSPDVSAAAGDSRRNAGVLD